MPPNSRRLSRRESTQREATWREELSKRLSWVTDFTMPQLDDPNDGSPIDMTRFSWISDLVQYPYVQDVGTQTIWAQDAGTQTADLESILKHTSGEAAGSSSVSTPNNPVSETARDANRSVPDFTTPTAPPAAPAPTQATLLLDGWNLYVVALGLMLSLVCCGLDRSIVAVATPAITSEFNSLGDVGWYGSSYLLTLCCFQLPFGKLYAELNKKWIYLSAVVLFEVGSVVCAAASSSVTLIVGRALSGVGGAGIMSGSLIIIGSSIAPRRRPGFIAAFGAAANLAQAFGPLIGGAFVENVSWRWCFWINLPLGGVTLVTLVLFMRLPMSASSQRADVLSWKFWDKLDVGSSAVLMPSIVCLLLALQWGGIDYPWSDWRCILLLCLFGILIIAWAYLQYRRGDRATVPLHIISQRSVAFGCLYTTSAFGAVILVLYYVPIWFQAVRGVSASQSGINLCALVLPWAFTLLIAATLTTRIGYYVPQMISATIIMSIMAGLMTTYHVDTSTAFWVVTLVFFGFGIGLGSQQPLIAVQTVLKGPDTALGTTIIVFMQVLSGSIMVSVGQNVLSQNLGPNILASAPGVNPAEVIALGTSNLPHVLAGIYPPEVVRQILTGYNDSLRQVFIVCLAVACITALGCAGMEWKNVKRAGGNPPQSSAEAKDGIKAEDQTPAPGEMMPGSRLGTHHSGRSYTNSFDWHQARLKEPASAL